VKRVELLDDAAAFSYRLDVSLRGLGRLPIRL